MEKMVEIEPATQDELSQDVARQVEGSRESPSVERDQKKDRYSSS